MSEFSRRDALKVIGTTAISAAIGSLLDSPPAQAASLGYVQQPLKAYAETKLWTSDPKLLPFRNVPGLTRDNGYAGKLGTASTGVMADYIVVNMFAEAASGASSIKSAIEQAESRAKRYYR